MNEFMTYETYQMYKRAKKQYKVKEETKKCLMTRVLGLKQKEERKRYTFTCQG